MLNDKPVSTMDEFFAEVRRLRCRVLPDEGKLAGACQALYESNERWALTPARRRALEAMQDALRAHKAPSVLDLGGEKAAG